MHFEARSSGRKSTPSTERMNQIGLTARLSETTPSRFSSHGVRTNLGSSLVHPRESIDFHYERKLFKVVGNALTDQVTPPPGAQNACDPRVSHAMTMAIDPFGNVLQSVASRLWKTIPRSGVDTRRSI